MDAHDKALVTKLKSNVYMAILTIDDFNCKDDPEFVQMRKDLMKVADKVSAIKTASNK